MFSYIELKILFSLRISMKIFNFVKTLINDYMFKIGLTIFMGIQAKLTIYFKIFK
jgi:hypothetical protein